MSSPQHIDYNQEEWQLAEFLARRVCDRAAGRRQRDGHTRARIGGISDARHEATRPGGPPRWRRREHRRTGRCEGAT